MIAAAVLTFAICGAPDPAWPGEWCEEGMVTARTCEIARRYVVAGIRPGQQLHIWSCRENG